MNTVVNVIASDICLDLHSLYFAKFWSDSLLYSVMYSHLHSYLLLLTNKHAHTDVQFITPSIRINILSFCSDLNIDHLYLYLY